MAYRSRIMHTYFSINPEGIWARKRTQICNEVSQLPPVSTFQHSLLICSIMAHLSSPILYYFQRNTVVVWGGSREGGTLNIFMNKQLIHPLIQLSLSLCILCILNSPSLDSYPQGAGYFFFIQVEFVYALGGLYVSTVTDIEVIVIARQAYW